MKKYYHGYNFTGIGPALHVFNTNMFLEYFQGPLEGKRFDPMEVHDSEVSEPTLQIHAATPVLTSLPIAQMIAKANTSQTPPSKDLSIPYEHLSQSFRFAHLQVRVFLYTLVGR